MSSLVHLEEAALNAWPALQTVLLGGWVARFANGYTKRANSVTPLYTVAQPAPLERQVAVCEKLYASRKQPAIFRLPSFCTPVGLDAALAAGGYRALDETLVQTRDLRRFSTRPAATFMLLPRSEGLDSWLDAFHRLSPARRDVDTHRRMMRCITGSVALGVVMVDGDIIGCGLGVAENGRLGIFDMVIGAEWQRQGHGRDLLNGLLDWGRIMSAHTAYLQVMANNAPARALYAAAGFETAYHYHYRAR